jgi:hypothetical protein
MVAAVSSRCVQPAIWERRCDFCACELPDGEERASILVYRARPDGTPPQRTYDACTECAEHLEPVLVFGGAR